MNGTSILIGAAAVLLVLGIIAAVARKRKFTYAEAMKYFLEQKKRNPQAVKGSLTKEDVSGGFVITQALLDKNGNVLEGSKIKVSALDEELLNLFKRHNTVIVE